MASLIISCFALIALIDICFDFESSIIANVHAVYQASSYFDWVCPNTFEQPVYPLQYKYQPATHCFISLILKRKLTAGISMHNQK
jgi:hypothetical protein